MAEMLPSWARQPQEEDDLAQNFGEACVKIALDSVRCELVKKELIRRGLDPRLAQMIVIILTGFDGTPPSEIFGNLMQYTESTYERPPPREFLKQNPLYDGSGSIGNLLSMAESLYNTLDRTQMETLPSTEAELEQLEAEATMERLNDSFEEVGGQKFEFGIEFLVEHGEEGVIQKYNTWKKRRQQRLNKRGQTQ